MPARTGPLKESSCDRVISMEGFHCSASFVKSFVDEIKQLLKAWAELEIMAGHRTMSDQYCYLSGQLNLCVDILVRSSI